MSLLHLVLVSGVILPVVLLFGPLVSQDFVCQP